MNEMTKYNDLDNATIIAMYVSACKCADRYQTLGVNEVALEWRREYRSLMAVAVKRGISLPEI